MICIITAYELNEKVTILDILQKYGCETNSKKRIPCPIHNGTDDNFCYTEHVFHCWSCGASGNSIDLVTQLFNLDFKNAKRKICNDFGLDTGRKFGYRDRVRLSEVEKKRRAEAKQKQYCNLLYFELAELHRQLYEKYGECFQTKYLERILDRTISDTTLLLKWLVDWDSMITNLISTAKENDNGL